MGMIGFVDHLALITCFISYKKWVQREKSPAYLNYSNTERKIL